MNVHTLQTQSCRSTVIQFQQVILAMFMKRVKARVEQACQQVVVVAVIKTPSLILITFCVTLSSYCNAAVLAEDRFDTLYHNYDGGGVTIDGPSILVRKSVSKAVSVSANYYVDSISSASIDVITQASPYTEKRTQLSLSADYLYDKSIMSYGYSTSTEMILMQKPAVLT